MTIKIAIIGGGVNGIAIARALASLDNNFKITVLEKESCLGAHSSTRNSGVIHAGFYYDSNSTRGKFCAKANALMRNYCAEKNIPLKKCGKVVVSQSTDQDHILHELYDRGLENNVNLEIHPSRRLSEYEPLALTTSYFLWSPNTWSSSPVDFLSCLISECKEKGVTFIANAEIIECDNQKVLTSTGDTFSYDYLVNAAGGYSLKIARKFGLGDNYSILPFKGLYLKSKRKNNNFKAHIYPVPDPRQTFLGIHTTLTYDGFLKLGPTAIPVLGPENYSLFSGLSMDDIAEVLPHHASLFLNNNFGFRDLAFQEFKYLFKTEIIKSANSLLVDPLSVENFDWYSPGIRAQLLDIREKKLVSDFVIENGEKSVHLLNTISPSWTCSLMTSNHIAKNILNHIS